MNISAFFDFNLVAKYKGFGEAARATGRSKATLSRRVGELETQIGVRLFERTAYGLKLTDAGIWLHKEIEINFTNIAVAADSVTQWTSSLTGRLRINAPVLFSQMHLGQIAAKFSRNYPELEISIVADDRMIEMIEQEFDVVIRANPPKDDTLVGRCFLRTDRVAVASPSFPRPSDGQITRVIDRVGEFSSSVWRLRYGNNYFTVRTQSSLHLSSLIMIRDAALAGAGAALLPRTLVDHDLKSGKLALWGIEEGGQTELWVLHTSRRLVSKKVKVFIQCLEENFSTVQIINT